MTTKITVKHSGGDKNVVIQLYVEGTGRKNKKADPILLEPGKETDITVWPGIAFEVKEEYTETEEAESPK